MKYKLKKKLTSQKSSSESKNLKKDMKNSPLQSLNSEATLTKSPTQSQKSNPFEVLHTNAPKSIKIDDLLKPRMEEVRKKRGRPSNESKNQSIPQNNIQPNNATPSSVSLNNPAVIAPSAIKPLLKLPFTTVAQWTEVPEINLTEKEADDLTPSLEAVMRQYSSQMNSPHAALIAFSISIGVISIQKMFIYKSVMKQRALDEKGKNEVHA